MGKCSNVGDLEKNENVTNSIRKLIYTPNFIWIEQWESVQNRMEMLVGEERN